MKEAYQKLQGTGFTDDVRGILSPDVLSRVAFETEVDVFGGTVYTLALFAFGRY